MVSQIKNLCKEHGTNLSRLEKELGLSNGTIKRWDANTPSADRLALIARYFGVSMEYLLTGNEKSPGAEAPELTQEEIDMLTAFRSLPPEDRAFVLRQLSALSQQSKAPAAPAE